MHARLYVAVAQVDHLLPKPARLHSAQLLPWVEHLLRVGHTIDVVYEACGFGFGLYRGVESSRSALLCHCST